MKITKLECVTREDYIAGVTKRIAAAHKTTTTGNRRGGAVVVSAEYGMRRQHLSNVVSGGVNPPDRMLDQDGLEPVTVYVRKRQGK